MFLIAWGIILLLDAALAGGSYGLFYGHLTAVIPVTWWAVAMIALGVGKVLAYALASTRWRLKLSALTVALFACIAGIAAYALLPAVGPLAAFVAAVAWWCHTNLIAVIALEGTIEP